MGINGNSNNNQNSKQNSKQNTTKNGGNDMLAAKPLNGTNATGLTREKKDILAQIINNAPPFKADLNKVREWWKYGDKKL